MEETRIREPRKLKSGWQARITVEGKDRSVGVFPTKKAAQAAELGKLDAGTFDDKTKGIITVSEFAPVYLLARSGELAPRSITSYEAHLRLHILPQWGHRRLRDIRPSEVAAWWVSMPATPGRKNVYRTFSNLMLMRLAMDDGELRETPCRVRKVGKDLTKPRPYYDQAAVNKLWDSCSEDMNAFLMVVYGGGLRISEALGLDRRHVNLVTGDIFVEQQAQLVKGRGSVVVPGTKNGESRPVYLGELELAAAKTYVKRHPAMPHMPFFMNEKGERLTKNAIYKDWMKARVEAGFPEAHIHDLRHSSLTQLMQQPGATLADAMAFAGHKDVRSAVRYQHSDPERLKSLVQARSAAL